MEVDQSCRGRPGPRSLLVGAGMAGPQQGARSAGVTMKPVAILLIVAFEAASTVAFAQGASDPVESLRACSLSGPQERLECLEKLSRTIARPARTPTPGEPSWIFSETT